MASIVMISALGLLIVFLSAKTVDSIIATQSTMKISYGRSEANPGLLPHLQPFGELKTLSRALTG